MKKFELTSETKILFGRTLYRIKALISFGNVTKGDLGGFVEKEKNLSMYGNAWVYGNARVYGNAWVYGNARVSGNAEVYGNARVSGNAEVSGNARVSGNAEVYGNANQTPIVITGLQYNITIHDDSIKIGCEFHSMADWFNFSDKEILAMDGKQAKEFWDSYKSMLIAVCYKSGRYTPEKEIA